MPWSALSWAWGGVAHGVGCGPEFFDLRSGLADEVFQTFPNGRVPVAPVPPDFAGHGERCAELIQEHRTHALIRSVPTGADARARLA